MSPFSARRERTPASATFSLLLLLAWIALVLVVTGRPIGTDDLWWHLALGASYAREGPWLDGDPLLFTPLGAPEPASWLFDVAAHGIATTAGFQGLRLAHVAGVLAIVALVASLAWRRSRRDPGAAALATGLFLAVSWYRLIQLRPELVTILFTLALYALLLARDVPPSRGRVAAACALMLVGANVHGGFLLGPILIAAGLAGVLVRAAWEHRSGAGAARDASLLRARRIATALALGLCAALLNPRGVAQHLAPFASFGDARLPVVRDEWSAFDPLALPATATRMSPIAWGVADALLLGFVAAAALLAWRLARDRTAAAVRGDEPVLLSLAGVSLAMMLVTIRLHWLAVFPVLLLLAVAPGGEAGSRFRTALRWAGTLVLAGLLLGEVSLGSLKPLRLGVPTDPRSYVTTSYAAEKYHAHAVWFLHDAELSGHLFANYYLGGFLGFWLAPRVQTFVNGTLNFPPRRLLEDYDIVMRARSSASGEDYREVLRDAPVTLFLGVGLPQLRDPQLPARYTTPALEAAPGWTTVFRNLNSAVYLHRATSEPGSLARVAAYYADQGIPFDPERGFEAGRVLHEHPDWAAAHGLAPDDYPSLEAHSQAADPDLRLPALERLGALYAALGCYEAGLAVERRILSEQPDAIGARRRLLFDLLHLGRADEVVRQALLAESAGLRDPLVGAYLRIAHRAGRGEPLPPLLPLFTDAEASRVLAWVPGPPLRPPPS